MSLSKKIILILFIYTFSALSFEIGSNIYFEKRLFASVIRAVPVSDGQIAVRPLTLVINNKEIEIDSQTVSKWLETFDRDFYQRPEQRVNPQKVENFLLTLVPAFKTPPINAVLKFLEEKKEIVEALPAQLGRELDIEKSAAEIIKGMIQNQPQVFLSSKFIEPPITLNKIKSLGITALLAQGESDFSGSPQSRIFNIKFGTTKYNGVLIRPGEEFSFNSYLGEVDEKSGFQPELVIREKKIIPEYGGGICQISTTMFRAVILAGLPIIERRPHSLPVRYYNPQGFDATVYPGSVDLRFKNDTPGPILIQTKVEAAKLYVELYGLKTGRLVSMDGPYEEVHADGSVKAYFVRDIKNQDGETKKETFRSSYKSPSEFIIERNPLE